MNKKEFREFLETVAELREVHPEGYKGKYPDDYEVYRSGDEYVKISKVFNPTLGVEVKKFKDQLRVCELGCRQVIKNQVIERRLSFHPVKHWRIRCNACHNYVSPDGNGLIHGAQLVQAAFTKFYTKEDK